MSSASNDPDDGPVRLAERLASSAGFATLFREGMSLLEETADYLDGLGRKEARALGRLGGLAYATESMKLTTRLMQLASWLLLQRAVNDGEMTPSQAAQEKAKVRLEHPEDRERASGFDELPMSLQELIARSLHLQERVCLIDRQLAGRQRRAGAGDNPVADQLQRVRSAFGASEG